MTASTASMYMEYAAGFRDWAVSNDSQLPGGSWSLPSCPGDFNRALTPPPDMNGLPKPIDYLQEHGQQNGSRWSSQHGSKQHSGAPYRLPDASTVDTDPTFNDIVGRPSRVASPLHATDSEARSDTRRRRGSNPGSIAVNFQIPRSVNDSGGSLSELAAQITCLFWFESSDTLLQVEEISIPLLPTKSLLPDAKPTTGFRKWVTTILSTTCVAQNVVLLALLFIYRLKKLNPSVKAKPGSEYRLLTVALMLGNKFLDDNTYTNKTWAEVSGINVAEVHIMEVEFLSNMRYHLFTSEQDWAHWQSLLGRFSTFFDRASRPPPPQPPAPILPPASSLYLPKALPSPPASNHASPPYLLDLVQNPLAFPAPSQQGPTPDPSPMANLEDFRVEGNVSKSSRKRPHDDYAADPAPKRMASGSANYQSPQHFSTAPAQPSLAQPIPRLTLPSLTIPTLQTSGNLFQPNSASQSQQLPPLNVPGRAIGLVYPSSSGAVHSSQVMPTSGPSSQPQSQLPPSHLQSPYGSSTISPIHSVPTSATVLQPALQLSPSRYLQQRSSPYRPIHNVSTLLFPPPTAAMQPRPQSVELDQMRYQPLGKQQPQTGRLPYVAQNLWVDGDFPHEMTPVHQWPGFPNARQRSAVPQH